MKPLTLAGHQNSRFELENGWSITRSSLCTWFGWHQKQTTREAFDAYVFKFNGSIYLKTPEDVLLHINGFRCGLGPKQERFVEALESGKYTKVIGSLVGDDYNQLCANGVCCEVLGYPHTYHADSQQFGFAHKYGFPPDFILKDIGLTGVYRLADLNDAKDMSFEAIAAAIRADPKQFFSEML